MDGERIRGFDEKDQIVAHDVHGGTTLGDFQDRVFRRSFSSVSGRIARCPSTDELGTESPVLLCREQVFIIPVKAALCTDLPDQITR